MTKFKICLFNCEVTSVTPCQPFSVFLNNKDELPVFLYCILCAKFSVDFSGTYEVDYTQRRNVKVQSGSNVLYNPYTTTIVKI